MINSHLLYQLSYRGIVSDDVRQARHFDSAQISSQGTDPGRISTSRAVFYTNAALILETAFSRSSMAQAKEILT